MIVRELEALQVNDEISRSFPNFDLLECSVVCLALVAVPGFTLVKLLPLRVFSYAVHEGNSVGLRLIEKHTIMTNKTKLRPS